MKKKKPTKSTFEDPSGWGKQLDDLMTESTICLLREQLKQVKQGPDVIQREALVKWLEASIENAEQFRRGLAEGKKGEHEVVLP
jgi:hypothetical protein